MAKIIFTAKELTEIVIANNLLPKNISGLNAQGKTFTFKIESGLPIFSFIPCDITYIGFENGSVKLQVSINPLLEKAAGSFIHKFQQQIPGYININFPLIDIDINRLLKEKNIKGVVVKDIIFENDSFIVSTANSSI